VLGWLLYRGAVRINLAQFFRWTGNLLVLVAAGNLAYGLHDLQEARLLPGLTTLAFDVSATVDPSSWYATLLKGILNFSPNTTWLQAVAWVLYVGIVLTLFLRPVRVPSAPSPSAAPAARTRA
jgi:high-affinity iron transporter